MLKLYSAARCTLIKISQKRTSEIPKTETELPESKGVYILIASVAQTKRLTIGRPGGIHHHPGILRLRRKRLRPWRHPRSR